jgi:predicted nucleotidyltransferase
MLQELTAKSPEELQIILNQLIKRVQPVFGAKLKKVVLFGSYARGDYDAESDVDLMLMINEDEQQLRKYRYQVLDIYTDINLKYDVLISGILQDYNKFNKYLNVLPFYDAVNKEGVVVYGH